MRGGTEIVEPLSPTVTSHREADTRAGGTSTIPRTAGSSRTDAWISGAGLGLELPEGEREEGKEARSPSTTTAAGRLQTTWRWRVRGKYILMTPVNSEFTMPCIIF
jgi:hypothetical protein